MHPITEGHLRAADNAVWQEWEDTLNPEQIVEEVNSNLIPQDIKTAALLRLPKTEVEKSLRAVMSPEIFRRYKQKLLRTHHNALIWAELTRLHQSIESRPRPSQQDIDRNATDRLIESYPHLVSPSALLKEVSLLTEDGEFKLTSHSNPTSPPPFLCFAANGQVYTNRKQSNCWHIHFSVTSNFKFDQIKMAAMLPLPYVAIYMNGTTLHAIFRVQASEAKEAQDFRREIQYLLTPFAILRPKVRTMAEGRTAEVDPDKLLFCDPNAELIAPADRILPVTPRQHPRTRFQKVKKPGPRVIRAIDVNPRDVLPRE